MILLSADIFDLTNKLDRINCKISQNVSFISIFADRSFICSTTLRVADNGKN